MRSISALVQEGRRASALLLQRIDASMRIKANVDRADSLSTFLHWEISHVMRVKAAAERVAVTAAAHLPGLQVLMRGPA